MMKAYGHIYFAVGDQLATARALLSAWSVSHPGERTIPLEDERHHRALGALRRAKDSCEQVPLGTLSREIDRALREHSGGGDLLIERCGLALRNIAERFQDELEDKKFLPIPNETTEFYGQDRLFGEDVFEKFKEARADVKSAGNCYALGQSTACVFHLMRAMEAVVRRLGRRMSVTITPNTTWRKITGDMDDKIKKMPDDTPHKKRKKNQWEESRANLHHVGSVWRNNTMHPAKTYTPGQAKDVLDACRVFMSGLCAL